MMDFSKVTGLTIPEGVVTQITDASGRVLWCAVKMAKLTVTSFWDGMDGDTARITVNSPSPFAPNPDEPNNKVTSWTAYVYDLYEQPNRTIKIPIGSTIECYITRDKGNADSYIKLNDINVATGEGTYVYTVTGDATIDVSEDYVQGDFGVISIVGAVTYISFTINGETYQAIEGMSWSAWFESDYNTTGKTKGDVENIKDANGNEVSLDAVIVDGTVYEVGFGKPVTVTITSIDGATPFWSLDGTSRTDTGTFEIMPDQKLVVKVRAAWIGNTSSGWKQAKIYLNNTQVAQSGASPGNSTTGSYTVDLTKGINLNINFVPVDRHYIESTLDSKRDCQSCYIAEIPEGYVSVAINNFSSSEYSYLTIDGVTYGGIGYTLGLQTVAIPSGTVVECFVKDEYKNNRYVKVDGVRVSLSAAGSYYLSVYNYIAVGNATVIKLNSSRWEDSDLSRYYYGYIEITKH